MAAAVIENPLHPLPACWAYSVKPFVTNSGLVLADLHHHCINMRPEI